MSVRADRPPHTEFDATPLSEGGYDVGDPEGHYVPFGDGHLFVRTYLPAGVSERRPTVLIMSPYNEPTGAVSSNGPASRFVDTGDLRVRQAIDLFVPHGYAVAVADVPGSGSSDGCIDAGGPTDVAAGSRMVEWLAAEIPWGNGVVGMYGLSYAATMAYAVATRGTPRARSFLKAIIPVSGVLSEYDAAAMDGVTNPGLAAAGYTTSYAGVMTTLPGTGLDTDPVKAVPTGRHSCTEYQVSHRASSDPDGDYSPFWADREYRSHVGNLRAATLMTHGQLDTALWAMQPVGFFDRIPEGTPHKLLFGHHGHGYPYSYPPPDQGKKEWDDVALAWFDRFLKGLPTGVEDWPAVQVQDASGTWRAQRSWPEQGTFGQLALGADLRLGEEVAGELRYVEGSKDADGALVYRTNRLAEDLRVSGMPVLDLWVKLARPDAHIVARLEVEHENGTVGPQGLTGARSTRHLDPLEEDRFAQFTPEAPPVHEAIHVPVRFQPGELLVPAHSSLRLTITWVIESPGGDSAFAPTTPSGTRGDVRVVFDCERPSVLRFALPPNNPELLVVPDQPVPPSLRTWSVDGSLARRPVCGREPVSPLQVTRKP